MPSLNERGFGSHTERVTQIFRHADGMPNIKPLFEAYFRQFPDLQLQPQMLELLFRQSHMKTHLLAVPIHRIKRVYPDIVAADISDLFGRQVITERQFGMMVLPTREALDSYVERNKLPYSPRTNLRNLRSSGFIIPRPRMQMVLGRRAAGMN